MTMTTDHGPSDLAEAKAISAYEAVGGRAAVTAAVDNFYGRLLADPVLAPLFRGTGRTSSRSSVRRWAAPSVTGGPTSPALTGAWVSATPISIVPPLTWPPRWTNWASPATWPTRSSRS